jgi:hypothetical protein
LILVVATTIRLFEFGIKLSFVGIICSVFLFPVYKFGIGNSSTLESMGNITDSMDSLSLSNIPNGSNSAIVTTIASYILFGAAMFLIVRDIEWFQEHRRDFLSKKQPENYSIYMSGLPMEYQSDAALKKHFTQQKSNVVEARVALVIPNLEQDVSNRDAIVENFEHAINVRIVKGTEPMHKTKMCGGEKVNSIPTYDKELEELNDTISKEIDNIESLQRTRNGQDDGDDIENPISKHEPKVVEDILVKNEEDEETDPASVHMAEMKIETSQNNGCKN